MTTALVFGAGGQLGQEIIACASAFRTNVIAHSRAQTDITKTEAVLAAIRDARPDVVVNAAAYVKVDRAESEPDQAYRVNEQGAGFVAEACAVLDIPLIHFSTDYVFDGKKGTPYVEDDPTGPLGVYGASKLAGEEAIRASHRKYLILRTSWVYGRHGTNFLKTMLKLAGERDEIEVVNDQHGSPTCTLDVAKVVLELTSRAPDGVPWGTYHFSGQGQASRYELADEIFRTYEQWKGKRPRLMPIASAEYSSTAAPRPLNSILDNTLFRTTFGLTSKPWCQSVQHTVNELMGSGKT
jgi:dTDP-4-dehydrorhamnose reductase